MLKFLQSFLFAVLCTWVCLGTVLANTSSQKLTSDLQKAKDYLQVKPSVSYRILLSKLDNISQLNQQQQLDWHLTLLKASVVLSHMSQIQSSISTILNYPQLSNNKSQLVPFLKAMGVWMRRSGHVQESLWLFQCACDQQLANSEQQLGLMLSKGLSLSALERHTAAQNAFADALELAHKQNLSYYTTAIFNALGLLAIAQHDYTTAKAHFFSGLHLSQKTASRSGQIISGLHLLLLAILERQPLLYQRLHPAVSRQVNAYSDEDVKIFLQWTDTAFAIQRGKTLSDDEKNRLGQRLEHIVDITMHNLIVKHLGEAIGATVELRSTRLPYRNNWLKRLPQCNWRKLVGKDYATYQRLFD